MMNKLPDIDEIEVSIFGPGYGESVLIHVGNGEWIIVDSCIERKTQKPAVLEYFDSIGADRSRVSLIIATHWHDDHIRGLGKVVADCVKATFVCSMAIKSKEFLKLAELYRKKYLGTKLTGVSEFISIFDTLEKNNIPLKYAVSERKIWQSSSDPNCTVHALSPSDIEISNSLASISSLIPQPEALPGVVCAPSENHSAVVLWIRIGENNILLGSDLEEKGINGAGWRAIVDGNMVGQEKAAIFKVAHHGSSTGYYQPVWKEMLHENPWTLLTPFSKGRKPLPSTDDIVTIKSHTDRAFITSPTQHDKRKKVKDPLLKKMISRHTIGIRYAEKPCSQIVLRKKIANPDYNSWGLTLSGSACGL